MDNPSYAFKNRINFLKLQWKIERSEGIIRRHLDIIPRNRLNQARHELKVLKNTLAFTYGDTTQKDISL